MSGDRKRKLAVSEVRAAVLGAGAGFQVITGGKREPPGGAVVGDGGCPLIALGHRSGQFYFLDIDGQRRELSARQLGTRNDLLSLFLGDTDWLRARFPKRATVKRRASGGDDFVSEEIVVDFYVNGAAGFLQAECRRAGIFGEQVVIRGVGVWADEGGLPIVHAGNAVMIGGIWHKAGIRHAGKVWAAAAPIPRPDTPCKSAVARELQENLRQLWNFRDPGGEIATLGLLGTAYYGAAAPWRACGFLIGGTGSGKSALLSVLRACAPLHHFSNDTTKAGLEQQIDGRAMPSFIDEASDREDQRGARALLDLVLSATGYEGTRGHRGGVDGHARSIDLAGSIIMASIAPPDMQPQHVGRFTLIELSQPEAGADHRDEHIALAARMRASGGALWGRALSHFDRYMACIRSFRAALGRAGCAPREADQLGALLAGWHVLVDEGLPNEAVAAAGVAALAAFVRRADDVAADDGPSRMVQHLMTTAVQMDRSTDRAPIGSLIACWLYPAKVQHGGSDIHVGSDLARRILGNFGIRPIRANEHRQPRMAPGDGVWFSRTAADLRRLFSDTRWGGDRWQYEMRRLESARASRDPIRIGGGTTRAIWVAAAELGFSSDNFTEEIQHYE